MKHLSTLLLIGFVGFNIPASNGATPTDDPAGKLQETSQDPSFAKPENANEDPQTQRITPLKDVINPDTPQKPGPLIYGPDGNPISQSKSPAEEEKPPIPLTERAEEERTPNKNLSTQQQPTNLEHTRIGRAVIEGNREEYKAALYELTTIFNTSLSDILQKKTSDGENIIDLMLATKENRTFFTIEAVNLTAIKIVADKSIRPTDHIKPVLEKAKQVNNELAVQLLSAFHTTLKAFEKETTAMKEQHETESTALKEQLLELVKKHTPKFYRNAGFSALGGVLAVWGYKVFSLSSNVLSSQIVESFSNISDKDIGVAAMIGGGALAIKGALGCKKSFQKHRQLRNQKKQLNTEATKHLKQL